MFFVAVVVVAVAVAVAVVVPRILGTPETYMHPNKFTWWKKGMHSLVDSVRNGGVGCDWGYILCECVVFIIGDIEFHVVLMWASWSHDMECRVPHTSRRERMGAFSEVSCVSAKL